MTAVLNKTPPRWYEAWYRPDSSPFAWGICVIWILVFIAEQQFAVWPGLGLQPDSHTNTALGGLTPVAVEHGQIWRFFTNPFLHGGPNHLRSDILALIGVGATLQAIVGRAWFCASFALLALVSEAVSYLMLPNDSVGTIGPAGTVMGLLAANFVCGFHFEDPKLRQRIWSASLQSLIMALVATFQPQAFPVDIPNHVTGTIAGLLLGCGFLIAWRTEQAKPKFERIARNFSRIFGAMAVVGAVDTMIYYPGYVAESARHIPGPQRQFLSKDSLGEMSELIQKYPSDPYGYLFRGYYYFDHKDFHASEMEARSVLILTGRSPFGPEYNYDGRLLLAMSLWQQDEITDAKQVFFPLCGRKNPQSTLTNLKTILTEFPLCD